MSNLTNTGAFSPESPFEPDLDEYTESVRTRIRLKNGEFFRNKDVRYTQIIVREFLNAAQNTFYVFCGKLNQLVYEPLLSSFIMAQSRGVDIKVITEASKESIESPELAKWLRSIEALRHHHKGTIPHFVLADGQMYRLEVSEGKKAAIVCACAEQNEDAKITAAAMEKVHSSIWDASEAS